MNHAGDIMQYLKPLSWDNNLSEKELEDLFTGKAKQIRGITIENIYAKLLASYNWYTLLKIAGKEKLKDILTDQIISTLKSKTLQEKYFYAGSVLY